MIDREVFTEAVARYLPQQRWFAGDRHALARVELRDLEVLTDEWPLLVWAVATGELRDGSSTDYQILAGLRPLGPLPFLERAPTALMGEVPTERGPGLAYNALHDAELAMVLLRRLAPDERADYVRQLGAEVASSILVYDERLLLRIFRRLLDGPNPDVETVRALAGVGFRHVAAPLAGWRRGDVDLAVLRQFVAGGAEGWQLALTSLRDLLDRLVPPDQAPGDFGPETRRLGEVTARLHDALARAFGEHPARPDDWADRLRARLDAVRSHPGVPADRISRVADRLEDLDDAGLGVRIHGDYQLRRVMRTDAGWYVLGFEGERPRPPEVASRFTSPLEDVAGMLRSFDYVAATAVAERADDLDADGAPGERAPGGGRSQPDGVDGADGSEGADRSTTHEAAAEAWEEWNGRLLLDGYLGGAEVNRLLPADEGARAFVLSAFELHHALRELRLELRGDLPVTGVAQRAIERILDRLTIV